MAPQNMIFHQKTFESTIENYRYKCMGNKFSATKLKPLYRYRTSKNYFPFDLASMTGSTFLAILL